jgi:hypothetical protein
MYVCAYVRVCVWWVGVDVCVCYLVVCMYELTVCMYELTVCMYELTVCIYVCHKCTIVKSGYVQMRLCV